jgi:hypothetical protein
MHRTVQLAGMGSVCSDELCAAVSEEPAIERIWGTGSVRPAGDPVLARLGSGFSAAAERNLRSPGNN